ncbi:MAG TPA: hypothetical protein PLQ09_01075 [Prolixibacteraceae bacterium]|nr:hypothetical protein [Prolixibacteraceae bacterium]
MNRNNTKDQHEVKHNYFVTVIIIFAVVLFAFGVYIAFFPIEKWGIKFSNDGFVSAIFSLIGAVLFFGALIYQIKEYQNQLKELKLSVEAQTKSGNELEAQRIILIQQNYQKLIFELLKELDLYRNINEVSKGVGQLLKVPQEAIEVEWKGTKQMFVDLHKKVPIFNISIFSTIYNRYTQFVKKQEFVLEGNYTIALFISLMDKINITLLKIEDVDLRETLINATKCHVSIQEWCFYLVKETYKKQSSCFKWDLLTTEYLVDSMKLVGIMPRIDLDKNDFTAICNYLNS